MKGLHVCLFLLLLVPSITHPLAKLLEPVHDQFQSHYGQPHILLYSPTRRDQQERLTVRMHIPIWSAEWYLG